ncbi:MAG: hypothetical protein HY537_01835, partial [Deltaproteobacteria bacterium]|nr:hypothetical protein [Deltaproteobacteria bacterium]
MQGRHSRSSPQELEKIFTERLNKRHSYAIMSHETHNSPFWNAQSFEKHGFYRQAAKAEKWYAFLSCFQEKTHLRNAASNFLRANCPLDAARIHERLGSFHEAASMYRQAGNHEAVHRIESLIEKEKMADLLAKKGEASKAVELYFELRKHEKAAQLLKRTRQWLKSAEAFRLAENYNASARMYLKAKRFRSAGNDFLMEHDVRVNDDFGWPSSRLQLAAALLLLQGYRKRLTLPLLQATEFPDDFEELELKNLIYRRIARWQRKRGNHAAAIRALRMHENSLGNRPVSNEFLIRLAFEAKDPERAATLLCFAGKCRRAAKLYLKLGMWEEAAWAYQQGDLGKQMAETLQTAGQYGAAAEEFQKIGCFHEASQAYTFAGQDEAAVRMLKAAGSDQQANNKFISLASKYLNQKKYQEAFWALREAGELQLAGTIHKKILQVLLKTKVKFVEPLGGGKAQTYLVKLFDGTAAVYKPDTNLETNNSNFEVAASVLDHLLGTDYVPITVKRRLLGTQGALQYFIADCVTGCDSRIRLWDLGDLVFFDYLLGVWDRHISNFLVRQGKIIAIDHGLAF